MITDRMRRVFETVVKRRFLAALGRPYNPFGLPPVLLAHLRDRKHISLIDVGAHKGEFTRAIDKFCGVSKGLLIEPQPERAADLARDLRPPRFRVLPIALSDRDGSTLLRINVSDETTSLLPIKSDLPQHQGIDLSVRSTVTCAVRTLDSVFCQWSSSDLTLLKLDVQGVENRVIAGGKTTLSKTEMVWTEVSFVALYEGSCLFHELHAQMYDEGFKLVELHGWFRSPCGELLQADALFKR
jgi:FkbM family methyltransferase